MEDTAEQHLRLSEAIEQALRDYWRRRGLYCSVADQIADAAMRLLQDRPVAFRDLRELSDYGLAEEARAREIAFQDALSELARRSAEEGDRDWDERGVAGLIALKRDDIYHFDMKCPPSHLPPPLFRMGYEWAALSIIRILEGVLAKPSEDICTTAEFQHVGKGLYKQVGDPRPSDPRRRAALDLIKEIERYGQNELRDMFFRSKRKNAYTPADDVTLADRLKEKQDALSGGLFRIGR